MNNRLVLKGARTEKKQEQMRLAARCQALIKALNDILQPAYITQLKDIETGHACELMRDLGEERARYLVLVEEIEQIDRDLGV